jgi:hypothetical protein
MSDIFKSIIGSIVSALIIALALGVWNDYYFKKDNLTGYWKVSFLTTESSYKNYIGLKTYYDFILNQDGRRIVGTGEKVSEDSVNGIIEYKNGKRTHLNLTAGINYKIFSASTIDLIYKEKGRKRDSSTVLNLNIESPNKIIGSFISTIASSKGTVTFERVQ